MWTSSFHGASPCNGCQIAGGGTRSPADAVDWRDVPANVRWRGGPLNDACWRGGPRHAFTGGTDAIRTVVPQRVVAPLRFRRCISRPWRETAGP